MGGTQWGSDGAIESKIMFGEGMEESPGPHGWGRNSPNHGPAPWVYEMTAGVGSVIMLISGVCNETIL